MRTSISRRDFLRAPAAIAATSMAQGRSPNVVLIYADDLGYGDLGCYGSRQRTPNLDRVAAEGMRFTHHVSANPVCSPSRASLLTGRYPTRVRVPLVLGPKAETGLPAEETTLAQMLKRRNYRTCCVGKWHLGHLPQYLPTTRGFDSYYGIPYSNDMAPRLLMRDTEVLEQTATLETLTPRYTEHSVRFIEESKNDPFFLYLAHTYPHIPLAASERFRGKSPLGLYGDVIEELDWSVGEILGALRRSGQDRNTLVLFSSDNGPWYEGSPGHLRGRKGMTWEGGVRVPFLARLPGRIPAGRKCDTLTSMMDIVPTVATMTGAPLPDRPLDGLDIGGIFSGRQGEVEREPLLYFRDNHVWAARWGRWKLHVARANAEAYSPAPAAGRLVLTLASPELYDLSNDPDESFDVAARNLEIVNRIRASIDRQLEGFPEEVRKANAEVRGRMGKPYTPGALPRA
ncbi:MAG: sulfatase family protein [Bryobacteraceae bacterium]